MWLEDGNSLTFATGEELSEDGERKQLDCCG